MAVKVLEQSNARTVLSKSVWGIESAFVYELGKLAGIDYDFACESERIEDESKLYFESSRPMSKDDIFDVRVTVDLSEFTATVEYKESEMGSTTTYELTKQPVQITYTVTETEIVGALNLSFLIGKPTEGE